MTYVAGHSHSPLLSIFVSLREGMDRSILQSQVSSMKKGLFDQGFLDEQFHQLEELQDDVSPNFVEEVVALFFRDSSRLIGVIEQAMEKHPQDCHRLETYMHQLKGSTSSIGALKVKNECTRFREYCEADNLEGCQRSFQKLKREHAILKQRLETYFQLLKQAGSAGKGTRSGK